MGKVISRRGPKLKSGDRNQQPLIAFVTFNSHFVERIASRLAGLTVPYAGVRRKQKKLHQPGLRKPGLRRGTEDLFQAVNAQRSLILEEGRVKAAMFFGNGVE